MEELLTRKCPHCGHIWVLRIQKPQRCPKCGHRLQIEKEDIFSQ